MTSDLGVCVCFFDGCRSEKMRHNFFTVLEEIDDAGMRPHTVVVECLLPGREPLGHAMPVDWWVHTCYGDVMWQKERLHQLGATELFGAGYDKILLLDGDLLYDDPQWPKAVSRSLDQYDAVQAATAITCNYDDCSVEFKTGLHAWLSEGVPTGCCAGGAWGYRSSALLSLPLHDCNVVGGGDGVMLCGAAPGEFQDDKWFADCSKEFRDHAHNWSELANKRFTYGTVDLHARTLPHGRRDRRCYLGRHRALADFDPLTDLVRPRGHGLFWSDHAMEHKPDMIRGVASYLEHREA